MKGAQGQQRRKIIHLLRKNFLPTAGKPSTHCWKIIHPLLANYLPTVALLPASSRKLSDSDRKLFYQH
jgi:hypothetical protein